MGALQRELRHAAGAAAVALAACGGAHTVPPPAPSPTARPPVAPLATACTVHGTTAPGPDTVFIAVERLALSASASRQVYEPLVRVDCEGNPVPGLASRWHDDENGSVWTFELEPGPTFMGGAPVDAEAVAASLERALVHRGPGPQVRSLQAIGDRSVVVRFDGPRMDAPRLLSDARFAIAGAPDQAGDRAGSGPYAWTAAPDSGGGVIILRSRDPLAHQVLKLVALPAGADLRDALERGIPAIGLPQIDVLVTRDAEVVAYVEHREDLRAFPLPWDLTYVLVAGAAQDGGARRADLGSADRAALARDAVRGDARGAEPPFWWRDDSTCVAIAPRTEPPRREVGFRVDDPTARELAERIVALAASPNPPSWIPPVLAGGSGTSIRVAALPRDSVDDAVARGRVAAAVVAYPRAAPAACDDAPRRAPGAAAGALVDSRAHVIVRRGVSLIMDGDGGIRFFSGQRP